jgi:hypothetical protein
MRIEKNDGTQKFARMLGLFFFAVRASEEQMRIQNIEVCSIRRSAELLEKILVCRMSDYQLWTHKRCYQR